MAGRSARAIYATARWRRLRLHILDRDRWTCRQCGRYGSEVHHVRALADGGAPWNTSNLATACRTCHIEHHRPDRDDPDAVAWRAEMRRRLADARTRKTQR